jgi:WD40 repeat protein
MNFFPLKYPDYNGAIDTLSWSPNSKLLAVSGPQKPLHIINAQDGRIIFQPEQTLNNIKFLSWSPDSNHIVLENDLLEAGPTGSHLQMWNITATKALFTFAGANGITMVKSVWSPHGNTIATLNNSGILYLWNATNGSFITNHYEAADAYVDLFWSPDGQSLALVLGNGNLKVWHIRNNHAALFSIQAAPQRAWLWRRDGRIALIDETKIVQYFNANLS